MDATGQITESFQSKIVLKRIRNFTVFHCDSALLSPSAAVSNHISNGRQLTFPKNLKSLHENRVFHGWRGCSGICLVYVPGICAQNQTYPVASAPCVTGSVSVKRFRLFIGQRIVYTSHHIANGKKPPNLQ